MFVAGFEKLLPEPKLKKTTVLEVMQKADSNSSDGASVDSEQKVEVKLSSSNDTKPNVVGIPRQDGLKENEITDYSKGGVYDVETGKRVRFD